MKTRKHLVPTLDKITSSLHSSLHHWEELAEFSSKEQLRTRTQLPIAVFYNGILSNEQQFEIGTEPLLLRALLFSDAYPFQASNFLFNFFKAVRSVHCPEET